MRKLIFYNLFHNGDIHFTRPFIRDIMAKTKDSFDEYHYLHYNDPLLMNEIPNLKFDRPNKCCLRNNIILRANDDIYVNVHIGCYDILFGEGSDGEGLSVLHTYYEFFKYVYSKLGIKIDKDDNYYIPEIDYTYCEVEKINTFKENNSNPMILIHNGPVFSRQFDENVDFYRIINELSDEFSYVNFFITDKKDMINKPNIFYTSDYCKGLNEISYLSTHCDIIFGMSSGPYVFSWVKHNLINPEKTFISITSKLRSVIWGSRSSCKIVWINKSDFNIIYETVKNEMKNLSQVTKDNFVIRTEDNKIYIKPNRIITPDDDLNILFYLGNELKWKHENFLGDWENWYIPFYGYHKNMFQIRLVFRTTKKLIFEIIV